jgi:hypothetical protein
MNKVPLFIPCLGTDVLLPSRGCSRQYQVYLHVIGKPRKVHFIMNKIHLFENQLDNMQVFRGIK